MSCLLTFPFSGDPAFTVGKLSADHEICWLPVLKTRAIPVSCFAIIEKIPVMNLFLCMGVVLNGLVASELRILKSHFVTPTGVKIFRGLLSFQRLNLSIHSLLKHRAVVFFLLSSTELVVRNFPIILYNVLLLGTADTGLFFNSRRLLPLKLAAVLRLGRLNTAIHVFI